MKNLISILILMLTVTFAFAQDEEATSYNEFEDATASITYTRTAKKVNETFSGYKVQIVSQSTTLSSNDAIFNQFGGITIERVSMDYAYCVGSFKSFDSADDYLHKVIRAKYPTARIIKYENGQRVDNISLLAMNAN